MDELQKDLKDQIARGNVVLVVGAGISMGASHEEVASWVGLLKHGVLRCKDVAGKDNRWIDRQLEALDDGDLAELLGVAELVSSALGGRAHGEYRKWLRDTVGKVTAVNREAIEALKTLNSPIVTTNYDSVLSEVTGLRPVTWREDAAVELALRGDVPAIVHLHGHWENSESVILGIRSYEDILGDEHTQAIQQAL